MSIVLAAEGLPISMAIVWLIAAVIFVAAEAATMGLTAIWFAAGSIAAMIAALLRVPLGFQIATFILISGVALYFTRGLAKKYINSKVERTNADRIVGMEGLVTEKIDNEHAQGQIRVNGQIWTARSQDDTDIDPGTHVTVMSIQGVKAIVTIK